MSKDNINNFLINLLSDVLKTKNEDKTNGKTNDKTNKRQENKKGEGKYEISIHSVSINPKHITFKNIDSNYDVLVLSGGGKYGILELGIMHYLQNINNINFNYINNFVGTSIGSIISYLLCLDFSPVDIFSHFCANQKKMLDNIEISITDFLTSFGIINPDVLFNTIKKMTLNKIGFVPTLLELYTLYGKHLICVTHNLSANIYEGENTTLYLDYKSHPNMSCIEAIKMSSNIPIAFEKYIYDKKYYVDGAVSDNYPLVYASKNFPEKKILGISVGKNGNSIDENIKSDIPVSIYNYIECLLKYSFLKNNYNSMNYINKNIHSINLIVNDKNEYLFTDMNYNFLLFSIGYNSYKHYKPKEKLD